MELVLSPLCIYHLIPRCLREFRVFTPDLGGFYMLYCNQNLHFDGICSNMSRYQVAGRYAMILLSLCMMYDVFVMFVLAQRHCYMPNFSESF